MGKTNSGDAPASGTGTNRVREEVVARRDQLFRSGWKNQKQLQPLVSREEDNKFKFLVHWCEEFPEVIHKHRKRLNDPNPRIRQRNGRKVEYSSDEGAGNNANGSGENSKENKKSA